MARYHIGQAALQGIFGAYLALYIPLHLFFLFVFWRRRALFPIRGRGPLLVVLVNLIIVMGAITLAFQYLFLDTYPCELWYFVRLEVDVLAGSFFFARLLISIYKNELAIELNSARSSTRSLDVALNKYDPRSNRRTEAVSGDWYSKHRYLLGYTAGFIFCAAFIAFFSIPGIVLFFVDLPYDSDTGCLAFGGDWYIFAVLITFAIIAILLAIRMREVVENMKIGTEHKWIGILFIIGVVAGYIFKSTDNFPVFGFINAYFFVPVIFVCSVAYPLILSYRNKDAPLSDLATLKGVLASREARDMFAAHLAKEFSLEHLVFLEHVRMYEDVAADAAQHPDDAKPKNLQWLFAAFLYDQYVSSDAPYQVNIPFAVSDVIAGELESFFLLNREASRVSEETSVTPSVSMHSIHIPHRVSIGNSEVALPSKRERELLPQTQGETMRLVLSSQNAHLRYPPHRVSPNLFAAAANSVFVLLMQDTFPRFTLSPEFKELETTRRHHASFLQL